jgi:chemosensory pili system protein ChpA (sensor histidine kinase/response regulator)
LPEESALQLVFQNDVPAQLRQMLQGLKQDESEENREHLQQICRELAQAGEQFDLNEWVELLHECARAIAYPENRFSTLAPILIQDLKQARDLVLAGRSTEIAISHRLQSLLPSPAKTETAEDDLDLEQLLEVGSDDGELANLESHDEEIDLAPVGAEVEAKADRASDPSPTDADSFSLEIEPEDAERAGPEMGLAELNSLADLFEGEFSDLDDTWEEEDIDDDRPDESRQKNGEASGNNGALDELDSDFSDLLFDEDSSDRDREASSSEDEFADLFGDDLLQSDDTADERPETTSSSTAAPDDADRLGELFAGLEEEEPLFADADESDAANGDRASESNQEADDGEWTGWLEELDDAETAKPESDDASSSDFDDFDDLLAIGTTEDTPGDAAPSPDSAPESEEELSLEGWLDETEAAASEGEEEFNLDFDATEDEGDAESDEFNLSFLDDSEGETAEEAESDEFDLSFLEDSEGETAEEAESDEFDLSFLEDSEGETAEDSESDEFDLSSLDDSEGETAEEAESDEFNLSFLEDSEGETAEESESDEFDLSSLDDSEGETAEEAESDEFDLSFLDDSDGETAEEAESDEFDLSFLEDSDTDTEESAQPQPSQESTAELDDLFGEDTDTDEESEDADLDDWLGAETTDTDEDETELDLEGFDEESSDFDDLDALMGDLGEEDTDVSELFDDLELGEDDTEQPESEPEPAAAAVEGNGRVTDEFAELDLLLDADFATPDAELFASLEALLEPPAAAEPEAAEPEAAEQSNLEDEDSDAEDDEFGELTKMLEETTKLGGSGTPAPGPANQMNRRTPRRGFEQTMRIPTKQLDNLSNLVGELVVNRNSLEQDQERLRQFLDNLFHQVQQLSDVGQRMQDLYERTLLEMALLASRQKRHHFAAKESQHNGSHDDHHEGEGAFDALEMDRFTDFHSLAQDIIELIVRVRESASDIVFLVDENDQVTRQLRQITTQLQEGLTRSRMVPFAQAADRLPRGVRDNAIKFGKQVDLQIEGRDTQIDKMIIEQLYDPMTHLVNNAVAHGIEAPEERERKGKSAEGRIVVSAFHQGNQTVISVSDDGAGIDAERVRQKAIEKGVITAEQGKGMSRLEIYDLLFLPGFSTKDKADDLSGRGVGMDVVRTRLSEIRGTINTDSTIGRGTTFTIRLPLTLSISKALCCISDRARIAFPMDGVEDMVDLRADRIKTDANGQQTVLWRDTKIPFQPLRDLLKYNRRLGHTRVYGSNADEDTVSIVVVRSGGKNLALQVDQVLGEQEIVIKQLEGPVPKPMGVAGATVMGDGRIVPIADVLELMDLSMGRVRRDVGSSLWDENTVDTEAEPIPEKSEPTVLIVDDSITVRELLSMTFKKSGYRVEQARDGQEAWEKLRAGLPCDLVFCDIEMPRMNGLELLSRMQKDSQLSELPIAMLTSRGADRHRQTAVDLGARGYFTKPYLEEALLEAAQRMLKGEVLVESNHKAEV